jgi:hypothetical protein
MTQRLEHTHWTPTKFLADSPRKSESKRGQIYFSLHLEVAAKTEPSGASSVRQDRSVLFAMLARERLVQTKGLPWTTNRQKKHASRSFIGHPPSFSLIRAENRSA